MLIVVSVVGDGETDAGGTFNIQHTCIHVPWIRIGLDKGLPIVKYEGTELSKKALHRRATRAAIEPQEEGVCRCIV